MFKQGDKVVFIKNDDSQQSDSSKWYNKGQILTINKIHFRNLWVVFDGTCSIYETEVVPEEIYNSLLYQALKEEEL